MIRTYHLYKNPGKPNSIEGLLEVHVDECIRDKEIQYLNNDGGNHTAEYLTLAVVLCQRFVATRLVVVTTNSDTLNTVLELIKLDYEWQVRDHTFGVEPKNKPCICCDCYRDQHTFGVSSPCHPRTSNCDRCG